MENQELLTQLYSAIVHCQNRSVFRLFEQHPEFLDIETPNGSWLHVAAGNGNLEIVTYLVELGVAVNAQDIYDGRTALDLAATTGRSDVVLYLLERGAVLDESKPERNPLLAAIYSGNLELVKLLVERGANVNVDYGSKSPVSFAESTGQTEIANFLRTAN